MDNYAHMMGYCGTNYKTSNSYHRYYKCNCYNLQKGIKINDILHFEEARWRAEYKRPKDAQSWKYQWAKEDAFENKNKSPVKVSYRPFDVRWSLYSGKSGGLYARPTYEVSKQFLIGENIGLAIGRQGQVIGNGTWDIVSITNTIMDFNYYRRGGELIFPLYIYTETSDQQTTEEQQIRTPNLNQEIVDKIAKGINHAFLPDENIVCDIEAGLVGTFSPMDILDYIYAVLHSPEYREKYKEFLKVDFPRVPYPQDAEKFWKLVELGGELRQLHLLESSVVEKFITGYPEDGDNVVNR